MFFVGGSRIWAFDELMRDENYKQWDKAIRENHHTKKASAVISQMKCLSSATSVRGVYVSAEQLTKAITAIHKQPAYQELWNWAELEHVQEGSCACVVPSRCCKAVPWSPL
jgi:hypothetical protein